MSYLIHEVKDDEGRGDLNVTEFAGGVRDGAARGPMLQFTITDYGPACCGHYDASRLIQMRYATVEALHHALGAWLLDCLVTGRVKPGERWKP